MFVALVTLMLAGTLPAQQASPSDPAPAVRQDAPTPPRVLRPALPVMRYNALRPVAPNLREATICAAHMELLIERVSARGMDVNSPIWFIQEYWLEHLPDPDGAEAIPASVMVELKDLLEQKAVDDPDKYLRQLQDCVTEAAHGGALDN